MARVFLSSASEDRPAMRRLAEALRRAGHEPWIDVDWIGLDGMNISEIEFDDLLTGDSGWEAIELAIERSEALIIGYSAATERSGLSSHYIDAFWTASAARKPAFIAHLDHAPLASDLIGAHVFELRRDSWSRDVEPLIAAITRPTSPLVGREAELAWLASHLDAGAPVAVVGESGVGKTALVAEYARRHAAEYPGGCLRAFYNDQVFGARWEIRGALEGGERSLLIFDEIAGDGSAYLGRCMDRAAASHVIVTTRTRPGEFPGAVLEISPLPHEDALLLFERRVGPPSIPAEIPKRNEIVTSVGGIPLALVSAADLYRRGWRLAYSAAAIAPFLAAAAPPGNPGRLLLEGTLPFADAPAPIAWAALAGEAGSEAEAAAEARRLDAAALVHLDLDSDTIMVHPAARDALRELILPEAQRAMRARAEEVVTRWMMEVLARDRVSEDPLVEHAEALARDDDAGAPSPWHGALQERLAELHRRRGDRARSLQLLERAERSTAPHRAAHGDLHAIVAARRASLAGELGDLDGARRALADAIAAAQSQPTDGSIRWRDIDPAAYEGALAAAIVTAELVGDPGNAARAAFLLADFHGRRGAWEQAASIAERALQAARRANEPLLVALAYRLLADVALHGSRYEDARASFEEAIRRLDELGAEELAATSRLLYVTLLLQLNRREAAVRHAERLRDYLGRGPADWPYHAEAEQALRLFDGSTTESDG